MTSAAPSGSPSLRALPAREVPLDPALWTRLAEAEDPGERRRAWLALQCAWIPGVEGALLLMGPPDVGPYRPEAWWPERGARFARLGAVAERGLRDRHPVVEQPADDERVQHLAYPIRVDSQLHGVVALELSARSEADLGRVMRVLQWGSAWIALELQRHEARRAGALGERQAAALELLASVLEEPRFFSSATALATQLATRLGAERVTLGVVRDGLVRGEVLSHNADFARHSNLMRGIERAMQEAVDQKELVSFPTPSQTPAPVNRAQAELAQTFGSGSVCSLPLVEGQRITGALCIERSRPEPFDAEALALCEAVAGLAAPVLELRRRQERGAIAGLREELPRRFRSWVETEGSARRSLVAAGLLLLLLALLARGEHRVSAHTRLEPSLMRAAVASFQGYLASVQVRPGDVVETGQLLATLDDRELRLERRRVLAERDQAANAYRKAIADRDAPESEIQRTRVDAARARLAMIDEDLARTRIEAPFAGAVVSGDLEQALGAPVARGDVLFELAPLDSYRVILEVDERDVAHVLPGQPGQLRLTSMPGRSLSFELARVTPVSQVVDGRNVFRVEAKLISPRADLRPGMEGVGKIEAGSRSLLWIWTHEIGDWLRLALWRWTP